MDPTPKTNHHRIATEISLEKLNVEPGIMNPIKHPIENGVKAASSRLKPSASSHEMPPHCQPTTQRWTHQLIDTDRAISKLPIA